MKRYSHIVPGFNRSDVSKPTFHTFYFIFKHSILTLDFLNNMIPDFLHKYLAQQEDEIRALILALNTKERSEYEKIIKLRKSGLRTSPRINIRNLKVQKLFGFMELMRVYHNYSDLFVKEMGLVFVVTKFEELLKNELMFLHMKEPRVHFYKDTTLEKIQGKNQEIELILFEEQIDKLLSEDIEEIGKKLDEKLGLDLRKLKNWDEFKERVYRRHVFIHNNGYPDDQYFRQTKLKKHKRRLDISNNYLKQTFTVYSDVTHYITDFLEKKFGEKKFHKDKVVFQAID